MGKAIEEYLKEMKLKKRVFGGVDEENVLIHIKKICDLYQEEQKEGQANGEAVAKAEAALKVSQNELELSKNELEKQRMAYAGLQVELTKSQQAYRELKEKKEQIQTERQSALELKGKYERQYQEFQELMETIQSVKKDAIVKAQVEAAQEATKLRGEIMAKVEEKRLEAEGQIHQLQREVENLQQQRDAMQHMVRAEAERYTAQLRQMSNSLETLKNQTESLADSESTKIEFTTLKGAKYGESFNAG